MMDEKTLKNLIEEMELRVVSFKCFRDFYTKEIDFFNYWDGKRNEAAFMVEKLTDILQHEVSTVKCDLCGKEWVAVRPEGLTELECPYCENMVQFENV